MAKYFPCFTDIETKNVLVFGGDAHALIKIQKLLPYSPCISVVACRFCEGIAALHEEGKINTVCGDFSEFEKVLETVRPKLVFVTEAEPPHDAAIFAACRARNIEINTEDKPQYCSFIFPSLIQRGALTVAIGTGGASPAVAKKLREEIESGLPDAVENILDWLGCLRPRVQNDHAIPRANRAVLWRELADRAFALGRPLTEDETTGVIAAYRA